MKHKCARAALLFACTFPCQAVRVATVGDSFADSLYSAMRARPDLLRQHDVQLARWSRPIIGLTRTDYFDYPGWLGDDPGLGSADVCLVQIGSNDMQSIPVAKNQWIAYGSPSWKAAYAERTRALARTLVEHRCGLVVWVLQPGFERRDIMACHRELINELQREAVHLDRTRVLELATRETDYGTDKTHFNRAYVLELGPALFHLVDTSRQILHGQCLACHRTPDRLMRQPEIRPLLATRGDAAVPVWAPERTGVQCRLPVARRPIARARQAVARRRHSLCSAVTGSMRAARGAGR